MDVENSIVLPAYRKVRLISTIIYVQVTQSVSDTAMSVTQSVINLLHGIVGLTNLRDEMDCVLRCV